MENLAKKRMTVQEYFTYEESSGEKHEFYRGELFAEKDYLLIAKKLLY